MRSLLLPCLLVGCALEAPRKADVNTAADTGPSGDTGPFEDTEPAEDTGPAEDTEPAEDTDTAAEEDTAFEEGAVVDATGARVLEESGEVWPYLFGLGDLAVDAGAELAVGHGANVLAVRIPDAGDAVLAESVSGSVTTQGHPLSDSVLGDLNGDGWADLVQIVAEYVPNSDHPYDEFFRYTPSLVVYLGPLADGPAPAWTTTLASLEGSSALESLVLDDLDGDGAAELLFNVGTSPGYGGETAAWQLDATGVTTWVSATHAFAFSRHSDVRTVGDVDGDGIVDLSVQSSDYDAFWAVLHLGPLGTALPEDDAAAAKITGHFTPEPLGDVDGDGRDDVAFRGEQVWIVAGAWSSGAVEALAVASIGSEAEESSDSALSVVGGDVGADGVGDIVITDTYWPESHGTEPKRGAVYVFHGMPAGTLDVREADTRVYGAAEGDYFGGRPMVLDDGRVAVQGYRDRLADAGDSWAVWLLEGL